MKYRELAPFVIAATLAMALPSADRAMACPGCTPIQTSFGQDIRESDVALLVELVEMPPDADGDGFPPGLGEEVKPSKFRIVEVLKGGEHVKSMKVIETPYLGSAKIGSPFLLKGVVDNKEVVWVYPDELSKRSRKYILDGMKLPESGPDRLAFFMNYLEDEDEILRRDAYDEFAFSTYDDLKALAPRLPHAELLARVKNPEITGARRRLYFTMIGACGKKSDLAFLEEILNSKDRAQHESCLDAIIGAYLAVSGPDGLKFLQDRFFTKENKDFAQIHYAVMAVRIAEESGNIKPVEAAPAFRTLLANPEMADQVVLDLARWEDWSVIDRLVELFINVDPEKDYIRGPVFRYLDRCPLPEAKQQLTRLKTMDPEAAKRALAFSAFPGSLPGAKAPAGKKAADSKESKDESGSTSASKADSKKAGSGS